MKPKTITLKVGQISRNAGTITAKLTDTGW